MDDKINRLDRSKYDEFVEIVKSVKSPIYIVPHKGVCYDAIGSGLGLKRVLESLDIPALFCPKLEYSRAFPQNRALSTELKLESQITDIKKIKKDSSVIYVDCHPTPKTAEYSHNLDIRGFPFAVIDHHPPTEDDQEILNDKRIKYIDIRETCSCVAMVLDYLFYSKVLKNLDKNDPIDVRLATSMLAGIRVDTNQFRNKKDMTLEHKYAPYLENLVDFDLIDDFENRKYPPEIKNIIKYAREITMGRYRIEIIDLDQLGFELDVDIVSAGVEALSEYGDASINILIGYSYKNKNVMIRARSSDKAYNASKELEKIVGEGWGKQESGGTSLELKKLLSNLDIDKKHITRSKKYIEDKIFENITKKVSSLV